jgi:hypothetical protein
VSLNEPREVLQQTLFRYFHHKFNFPRRGLMNSNYTISSPEFLKEEGALTSQGATVCGLH